LTATDALLCFDDEGVVDVGAGEVAFTDIGVGDAAVCGVRADGGALTCFPQTEDEAALTTVPPGRFTRVEVGDAHACALRDDGAVLCWGDDGGYGRMNVPAGSRG
jgi:hypothetical protein